MKMYFNEKVKIFLFHHLLLKNLKDFFKKSFNGMSKTSLEWFKKIFRFSFSVLRSKWKKTVQSTGSRITEQCTVDIVNCSMTCWASTIHWCISDIKCLYLILELNLYYIPFHSFSLMLYGSQYLIVIFNYFQKFTVRFRFKLFIIRVWKISLLLIKHYHNFFTPVERATDYESNDIKMK